MSRFTRYSRISLLELCLERERRAWRCAAVVALACAAVVVAALVCPASEGLHGESAGADFTGVAVVETLPAPEEAGMRRAAPLPVPPVPAVELPAELPLAVEVLPCAPTPPEWEVPELEDGEPLLALDCPVSFRLPSAASPRPAPTAAPPESAALGEFVAARYRQAPHPPYPPAMLNRRAEGRVGLRINLDAAGEPQQVEVSSSSGYAAFDRCACEWVLAHWRFHPARQGGVAVPSVVRTQVEFVLR